MKTSKRLSKFPEKIVVSEDSRDVSYLKSDDYYAVFNPEDGEGLTKVSFYLEDGRIAVVQGKPTGEVQPSLGAVYTLGTDGPLAVPTGRVFIRFKEGDNAATHQGDIEKAGYTIEEIPVYAPHAAWLQTKNGDKALALQSISKLRALEDVEHVEPQVLMQQVSR